MFKKSNLTIALLSIVLSYLVLSFGMQIASAQYVPPGNYCVSYSDGSTYCSHLVVTYPPGGSSASPGQTLTATLTSTGPGVAGASGSTSYTIWDQNHPCNTSGSSTPIGSGDTYPTSSGSGPISYTVDFSSLGTHYYCLFVSVTGSGYASSASFTFQIGPITVSSSTSTTTTTTTTSIPTTTISSLSIGSFSISPTRTVYNNYYASGSGSWSGGRSPYNVYVSYGSTQSTCTSNRIDSLTGTASTGLSFSGGPYVLPSAGTYYFCMKVVDSNGIYAISPTVQVTAVNTVSSVSLATSPTLPATIATGQTVTLFSAWSGGISPYTVKYTVTNANGGATLTTVSHSSITGTSDSLTYTPPAGRYTFTATVADSESSPSTSTSSATSAVNVITTEVQLTPSSTSVVAGDQIDFESSITGVNPPYHTIKIYQCATSANCAAPLATIYSNPTLSGEPSVPVSFSASTDTAESASQTTEYFEESVYDSQNILSFSPIISVTVTPSLTIGSFTIPANVDVGSDIAMSSTVYGGVPGYTIEIRQCSSSTEPCEGSLVDTIDSDSNPATISTSLATSEVGTEYFQETVTDSAGTTVQSPIYSVIVTPSLILNSFTVASSVEAGKALTFQSSITGDNPPFEVYIYQCATVTSCPESTAALVYSIATSSSSLSDGFPASHNPGAEYLQEVVTDSKGTSVSSGIVSTYVAPTANVLIVTAGVGESTSISDLRSYENMLSQDGQTYLYVELDNPIYTQVTGQAPPTMGYWPSVKNAINTLETLTGAQYVLILGDANVIPMPNVVSTDPGTIVFETSNNPKVGLNLPTAVVPTDDPYGEIGTETSPSVIVARMPGSTAAQINQMLINAVNVRYDGNTDFGAITDTYNYQKEDSPGQYESYGISSFTNGLMATAGFVAPGSNACTFTGPQCFYAPYYCTLYDSPDNPLASLLPCYPADVIDFITTYGIQFFGCHGDGWDCGSQNADEILLNKALATMYQNPIVIMTGCFDGEIPGAYLYAPLQGWYEGNIASDGPTPLAQAMLNNGASVYIGFTTEYYGAVSPNYIGPALNRFVNSNGTTIGMTFLDAKIQLENSGDPALVADGEAMQIYGDPTLTHGEIGSLSR